MRLIAFLSVSLLVGACASQTPQLPEGDVPEQWTSVNSPSVEQWPSMTWWEDFQQPELTRYLTQVREQNLSLGMAQRNLRIAQINLRDAGFDLAPTPGITVNVSKTATDTLDDGVKRAVADQATATATLGYSDILKKPGQFQLARATFAAVQAQQASIALDIYNTAAQSYFQLLFIREQLAVAQQNLDSAESLLNIIQSKVDNGTTQPLDALQQRIAVQQQRNALASLQQNEFSVLSTLALLVAKPVTDVHFNGDTLADIVLPEIQPGLPAALLERRPDIIQAEANLQIASANQLLARLAFLPNISLTAQAGAVSDSLAELIKSPTVVLSAAASVVETLLDNGARARSNTKARLRLENSVASYRQTALAAFNEVNVLLQNARLAKLLSDVAQADLHRAEEANRIAQIRYQQGAEPYQTLLTTQNAMFAIRVQGQQTKLDRINTLLALYQALGGGWQKNTATEQLF